MAPRRLTNWAGNLTYRATELLEPASIEELQELMAARRRLRPSGTRHSFGPIGDTTSALVSVRRLPRVFDVDAATSTVTVDGGASYGAICERLDAAGLALQNLPSLPHITVAGACATGTHGSGDRLGVLSTSVVGLELVTADGARVAVGSPGNAGQLEIPLAAAAVSLGALGVVTATTLRVEPAYDVRQVVYERVPSARFEDVLELAGRVAYSASLFTTWREDAFHQVWLKQRMDRAAHEPSPMPPDELPTDLCGGRRAARNLHPIPGFPSEACSPQLGIPGPWFERLPHFRLSHTPSSGDELQSEYFVPRSAASAAFRALDALRDVLAPVVQVSEIRTMPKDDLWLSSAYARDTVSFHFTWIGDARRVLPVLPTVERALEPLEPRAHWAKLSSWTPSEIVRSHPRLTDFGRLAARVDPSGKLRNEHLDRLFAAA